MLTKIPDDAAIADFRPGIRSKMAKAHAFPGSGPCRGRHRRNRYLEAAPGLNSCDLERNALEPAGRLDHRPFWQPPDTKKMQYPRHAIRGQSAVRHSSLLGAAEVRPWLRRAMPFASLSSRPPIRRLRPAVHVRIEKLSLPDPCQPWWTLVHNLRFCPCV